MEQIKILFFSLLSFFGIEDSRIAANKTTITIYPVKKSIEIIQEDLFVIIDQESDTETVIDQWSGFINANKENPNWSKELESFTNKTLRLDSIDGKIQPQITLNYSSEKDLRSLGIWYNENEKVFSINHIPIEYLQTKDGKLEGNYWRFDGTKNVNFIIKPFENLPENFTKFKRQFEEIIKKE